jgi:hypothetical protein
MLVQVRDPAEEGRGDSEQLTGLDFFPSPLAPLFEKPLARLRPSPLAPFWCIYALVD